MRLIRPRNLFTTPASAAIAALVVTAQLLAIPLHGLHHHDHDAHDHHDHEHAAVHVEVATDASSACATCVLINQSRAGVDVAPRVVAVVSRISSCHFRPALQPPAANLNRIASPRAPPVA